ncbi:MAG TPA: PQQ-dependent sugar dehydrogenase, partial [Chitinophagaceae bacterium]|nr:PQQ-dependent sugar dehydrogenase [Chitinophagaceae bacterium]
MNKQILTIAAASLLILNNSSCNLSTSSDNSIATDSVSIAAGGKSFNINCSGCHNFRQDAIGPQLTGLTNSVSADWIANFIKDPQQLINAKDAHAVQLHEKYKTTMPSFSWLKEDEIKNIIAFIHSHKENRRQVANENDNSLSNPIPEPIKLSDLVVDLQLVTQVPASSDSGKSPLARITEMKIQPGTNDLFVVDLRGKLYRLRDNKSVVYMDIAKLEPRFINEPGLATGFGSFAFHPDFFRNGLLYTTHTEAAGSIKADFRYPDSIGVAMQWVLTEWKVNDPKAGTFSGTGRELLRVNMPTGIHGVQEVAFNPLSKRGDEDYGLLYMGVGDGGAVENGYQFLAHDKGKIWGTILRIDPAGTNSTNHQYGIPPTNPFAKDKDALGEIYAYGFRNPHRFAWTKNAEMLACNVGHSNIESINLITSGHDYGWPIREGNFLLNPYGDLKRIYSLPVNDTVYKVTYPVAEYDHDEGKAISGGYEYAGAMPALKGKFLFGDIPTGRLFYIDMADIKQGRFATIREWRASLHGEVKALKQLCGNDRVDLHFGRDAKGELYIMT